MQTIQYNKDFNKIVAQTKELVQKKLEAFKSRQFHFTIANFKTFFPEVLQQKSNEKIFTELLYIRSLAPLDTIKYTTEVGENFQLRGAYDALMHEIKSPVIFCVSHLGSYRSIITLLTKLGYDFSLVIDKNVFETQGESIKTTFVKANDYFKTGATFDMINAEEFDAAMKMVKRLKEGKALVLYIDGNTGTGGVFRHDEKLEVIDFFGKPIFARQGIAYISYLTNVPIVPIVSYRENIDLETPIDFSNVVIEVEEAISPASAKSKKMYCTETTQALFKLLENKIRKYPLQWEGWLYVHKYIDEKALKEQEKINTETPQIAFETWSQLIFNTDRFGLFTFGDQYFLFDHRTYQTFSIEKEEFEILKSFLPETESAHKSKEGIDKSTAKRLLENSVLVIHNN